MVPLPESGRREREFPALGRMIGRGGEHRGAEVCCACCDRHAGRLRVRGSGHREPADVALRRVRVVRGARARGVRRPMAGAPRGVPRSCRCRCRAHRTRDALLPRRVARCGRDRSRRVRDALQLRLQRLPRGGLHRSDPPLCPAREHSGAEFGDPGPPPRVRARGRRGDGGVAFPLAASPAGESPPVARPPLERPSTACGEASSARSTVRRGRATRPRRSPHCPTSSTGCCRFSSLRSRFRPRRTPRRWPRPAPFCARASTG